MKESLIKMMEQDLNSAIEDWSSQMTFGRNKVAGTFSVVNKADNLSEDGVVYEFDAQFACPVSAMPMSPRTGKTIIPEIRDVVIVDGNKYWVESIAKDPAGIVFNLKIGE